MTLSVSEERVIIRHVERFRRKEERSKQGQTNNKAKQHSTPKAVTFPRKNELPRVGLEPTTVYVPFSGELPAAAPMSWQRRQA